VPPCLAIAWTFIFLPELTMNWYPPNCSLPRS
jgi:hypothetical protein